MILGLKGRMDEGRRGGDREWRKVKDGSGKKMGCGRE